MKTIKEIGYRLLKKFKSRIRRLKLKKTGNCVNFYDIVKDLKKIGIKKGDVLIVHSSLSNIGYVEGGARTVIEALLEVIGKDGTLVIPTYPLIGFKYNTMVKICKAKDYIFDYESTPTGTGAIPSAFLKFEDISRSIHPTHSVSAIGKYAKEITESHHIGNQTFGYNSPWGKIINLNGKIMGIGISIDYTTQYHHVEDIMGNDFPIKVKLDEIYKVKCKLNNNKYIYVDVQPLDPEVAKTRIEKNKFIRNYLWEVYKQLGMLNIGKIGAASSWWVNAKDFCDILRKLANIGVTIYSTMNELKKKDLYPFKEDLLFNLD